MVKTPPLQEYEKEALLAVLPVLIEIQDRTMSNKQLIPTMIAWLRIKYLVERELHSMTQYLNIKTRSSFEDKEKLLIAIDPIIWNKQEKLFTFFSSCILSISLIITFLSTFVMLTYLTNWATSIFAIIVVAWLLYIKYLQTKFTKKLNAIRFLNSKLYLDLENTLAEDKKNYPYGSIKQF